MFVSEILWFSLVCRSKQCFCLLFKKLLICEKQTSVKVVSFCQTNDSFWRAKWQFVRTWHTWQVRILCSQYWTMVTLTIFIIKAVSSRKFYLVFQKTKKFHTLENKLFYSESTQMMQTQNLVSLFRMTQQSKFMFTWTGEII